MRFCTLVVTGLVFLSIHQVLIYLSINLSIVSEEYIEGQHHQEQREQKKVQQQQKKMPYSRTAAMRRGRHEATEAIGAWTAAYDESGQMFW